MSGGNRRRAPDHFGIGLAASTALLVVIALYSYKENHEAERIEASKAIRDVALSECVAQGNLISGPICKAMVENAEAENKGSISDLKAQQDMAKWALLMLIVTGAGVIYIAKTLSVSKETLAQATSASDAAWEAVNATKDVGERQIRAAENAARRQGLVNELQTSSFLIVPKARIYVDEESGDLVVDILIVNTGQTPAHSIYYGCKNKISTNALDTDEPVGPMRPSFTCKPLGPGESKWCSVAHIERANEYSEAIIADKYSYILEKGVVSWANVFHKRNAYVFAFHRLNALQGPKRLKLHLNHAGNMFVPPNELHNYL